MFALNFFEIIDNQDELTDSKSAQSDKKPFNE